MSIKKLFAHNLEFQLYLRLYKFSSKINIVKALIR
jgi:hypothetical protein